MEAHMGSLIEQAPWAATADWRWPSYSYPWVLDVDIDPEGWAITGQVTIQYCRIMVHACIRLVLCTLQILHKFIQYPVIPHSHHSIMDTVCVL